MKKFVRKKIPLSLEMAPLVDIILLLLVFFLLTTSLGLQKVAQLDLPEASTANKEKEGLNLVINREGEIFVEGKKINPDSLFLFLRLKLEKEEAKTISIEADANVPFKIPVEVMDICRRAGAQGVSIATRQVGGN